LKSYNFPASKSIRCRDNFWSNLIWYGNHGFGTKANAGLELSLNYWGYICIVWTMAWQDVRLSHSILLKLLISLSGRHIILVFTYQMLRQYSDRWMGTPIM